MTSGMARLNGSSKLTKYFCSKCLNTNIGHRQEDEEADKPLPQEQKHNTAHIIVNSYGVSMNGGIKTGWDDLGVPLFQETII